MLTFIDLFAGLGGFHVGLEQLGMKCVFASELNKDLQELYHTNYGLDRSLIHGDIRNVRVEDIPPHSLLCGGFPCQPFSKAGAQEGMKDKERGNLFDNIMHIVRHHKTPYVLLENVANLLKHDNHNTWRVIKSTLEAEGYQVDYKILSPNQFGVPQLRQRMFIVAARKDMGGLSHFQWPEAECHANMTVRSILEEEPTEARSFTKRELKALAVWQEFLDCIPENTPLPSFPIWATEYKATYPYEATVPSRLKKQQLEEFKGAFGVKLADLSSVEQLEHIPTYARGEELFPVWKQQFIRNNRAFFKTHKQALKKVMKKIRKLPFSWQKFEWNCKGADRKLDKLIIQFRPSGIRVKRDNFFPALVSSTRTQVPAIGWLGRYITPTEGARLQSLGNIKLPTNDTAAFRALGNAVNAEVVKQIAARLVPLPQPIPKYQPSQQRLALTVAPSLVAV
ncbi:DNA (cytosine-5-)-methyltransferase [Hymenobacter gummosus]|uniref:Cytosine-specific methyltransferase n=1 Tax=Hymenobacter gummosus TaxID=1776032 RepID=A0A3S0H1J2_9BACT|nr:DNA (cytosine-5-)-methyltransferase [Hymenobacter gummosus]RTQ45842.1 DNA (cytosine-5-)-methyltransferase [Hymenobacter gummosus]